MEKGIMGWLIMSKFCSVCGEVYFGDLADATHCLHCVWENDEPKELVVSE